jgi:hypothetical protein
LQFDSGTGFRAFKENDSNVTLVLIRDNWRNSLQISRLHPPSESSITLGKNRLKRDGPLFLFSGAVKFAGDEKKIIAIVAPHRGETSRPADILHFPQLGPASRWSGDLR